MSEAILTHDAGISAFDSAEGPVSTTNDSVSFNWDEDHIVRVDAPSDLETSFDTDRFYKVSDATIARPIKQDYVVGDSVETYKKPADELRKAAWSFDNKTFPLTHPNSGMVKNVDDIHGFWRNVSYNDEEDRLMADLYVPANDDEALDFIEEHQDVSIGFYNRVQTDYDGDTGDLDGDDVDGYQVDIYGDHIAGVKRGRCSGPDGCGLDGQPHGEIMSESVDTITADDRGDEDNAEPTEDCGCDNPMSDTDETEDGFDIPDLSVDAIAAKNDAISELKEERDTLRSNLDEMESEIEEALDSAENFEVHLDEDECVCDAVEDLVADLDEKAEKAEQVEELQDELQEYREDEREEALDTLEDLGADTDEFEDADLPELESEIDRREEVLEAADADVSVKGTDEEPTTDDEDKTQSGTRQFGRGYSA